MNPITEALKWVHEGSLEPSHLIQPELMRYIATQKDSPKEIILELAHPVYALLLEDFLSPPALSLETAQNFILELEFREEYARIDQQVMQGKEISLIEGVRDLLNKSPKVVRTSSVPRYDLKTSTGEERTLDLIGLKYGIPLLDQYCKPLEKGDAIMIAGRPNIGKSSLAAALAEQAIKQNFTVLWCNNESKGSRILSRFSHLKQETGNIIIRDIHGCDLKTVEALVIEEKPTLVIVDMLDHIRSNALSQALKVEALAVGVRELAAKHGFVLIHTAQLDETAKEVDWPKDNQIKDSKTAKQGAVDIILLLAGDPNKELRLLSIGKNKEGQFPSGRGMGSIHNGIFYYDGDYNATR